MNGATIHRSKETGRSGRSAMFEIHRIRDRRILWSFCLLMLVCRLDSSHGMPAEQPTKFSLNTGNIAEQTVPGFDRGREILDRVTDALRIGTGRLVNSVTLARNIIIERAETFAGESRNTIATTDETKSLGPRQGQTTYPSTTTQYPPVTNTRPNARETVRLENESAQSLLEKPADTKPIAGVLESILRPTPIVDGIKEANKYGNNGDRFIGIGRALVNGFEGLSNFLNAIVDFPRNAARTTSRGITEALNQVGARLVGLQ